LEAEVNEKLGDVYQKLLQAGFDKTQSEKEAKLKETLTSLQRLFPGVRGRVVDLCKPAQQKHEIAVSVILGCNVDAAVVNEETTAIKCIEVCSFSYLPTLHDLSLFATIVYTQSTGQPGHAPPSRHPQNQAN
jgi:chromosome segregation ATPase